MEEIDQTVNTTSCEKFKPQENLGVLVKLTNQIWCKIGKKPSIERQITDIL